MPGYLKTGETYESRLDELLDEYRRTPSNATTTRERIAQEVALIGVALRAIPAATVTLESFDFVGNRPDVVTIDDALAAFDQTITDRGPVKSISEERAEFLRRLVGAEPEAAPYSFTPDVIRKVEDTLALQPNADGSTPRLPGEQTVATDDHPEVDFEAEVDLVGTRSDLDDLDPETIPPIPEDDEDDDLADFTPKSGKPAKKPETALSALKTASKKKETKK